MQFIPNGPEIPDALLRAQEEARLVFFCGAGISYPAGLPNFEGLVKEIYKTIGTDQSNAEKEAFDANRFDSSLDLLERRLPGERLRMRRALEAVLKPKLRRKAALATHEALLQLARNRDGTLRLVTTNFDRVFHAAAKRIGQTFRAYEAPLLPIPKKHRWDGIVYLHGLLPKTKDDSALNSVVVTSGDFGLAYLTERWAARFATELFRNYVVCFVGYSLNDPVLRYMMDALAADRRQGEAAPEAWVLADAQPGQQETKTAEWRAKGVVPILYEVATGDRAHSALHNTLRAWAETYSNEVLGKERIVAEYAVAGPSESTAQDDFVGRMLWALSDESGLPAKSFADFNPVPPLEWLFEAFSKERPHQSDLVRADAEPIEAINSNQHSSLIQRQPPNHLAPPMALVSARSTQTEWDSAMSHLGRWLTRHLGDGRLLLWLAQRGGHLHPQFRAQIEERLTKLAAMQREGNIAELDEIRGQAPNAIPDPLVQKLWLLLVSGRIKSRGVHHPFYEWTRRLKAHGLSTPLRMELREILAPRLALREAFGRRVGEEITRFEELLDWDLVLPDSQMKTWLKSIQHQDWWTAALPDLLEDLQHLLLDALDLRREFHAIDDRRDLSYWDLPSIEPDDQNRGFREWVTLIEMLRDAWLAVREADTARATDIADRWFARPYPTFKRLALFAASRHDDIGPDRWVHWLLTDSAWWLWAEETKREVLRLFVLDGGRVASALQERLEQAILDGPPQEMFGEASENQDSAEIIAYSIWHRLAKLNQSGLCLGQEASARLTELSTANPQWKLHPEKRDELSHYTTITSDPDLGRVSDLDVVVDRRKRSEIVEWLKKQPKRLTFSRNPWREICRTHFAHSLCALNDLAEQGEWPSERWIEALQTWSERKQAARSWRYAAPVVRKMPNEVLKQTAHTITNWLSVISKSAREDVDTLLEICGRILVLPLEASTGLTVNGKPMDDPLTEAINHPIGRVTEALISHWFVKEAPKDNDGLPPTIERLFTQICDLNVERFRHGRVLLGTHLVLLYRVDREWTETHILRLLTWENRVEARAVWTGFLWSPRLYAPLFLRFKSSFLETAHHYAELGEQGPQFSAILTYAALERHVAGRQLTNYAVPELRSAFEALPPEGLERSAQTLLQALKASGDRRESYWSEHVQPVLREIWPQFSDRATPRIAESLALLVIAAGSKLPDALALMQDWLRTIDFPYRVIKALAETEAPSHFPMDALALADVVIGEPRWPILGLKEFLERISNSTPGIVEDPKYKRLHKLYRSQGINSNGKRPL
ncbi:MAG: SIR2 family protein [Deltaproteobacteria bacterium]|nr:SIR2 family protein [Deltaproteobacteria bacterium]